MSLRDIELGRWYIALSWRKYERESYATIKAIKHIDVDINDTCKSVTHIELYMSDGGFARFYPGFDHHNSPDDTMDVICRVPEMFPRTGFKP